MKLVSSGIPGQADVKLVGPDDKAKVLAALTLAFAEDPLMRWLLPDGDRFLRLFPQFCEVLAEKAFSEGGAIYVGDHDGAALWLPPGHHIDEEKAAAFFMENFEGEHLETVVGVLTATGDYHPQDEPCWYLSVLGIDMAKQGRGLGALLMKDVLRTCDEDGILAYLESSNPRNISFYERHGFEVMGEINLGNPEPVTPMIRKPR